MNKFQLLPLTLAVSAAFVSTAHAADSATPSVVLPTEYVVSDRQGTKVKTNVVTTAIKDESTATDLRGLLKEEPAIEFGGGNGTSQFIAIRGMGQNSIDVKVDNAHSDGQMLYHQGRHQLDPALVKIVSVQKGAGSASAGIGATNGAIIAKTVDAKDLLKNSDKDWGVKVNAGYSENSDSFNYGVAAFGKTDQFDLLLSANQADEKDYKAGKDYQNPLNKTNTIPFSSLDKRSYLAKAGVNLGNHRFVLSHTYQQNKGVRTVREEFTAFGGENDVQAPVYREMTVENTNLEWTTKNLGIGDITANAYLLKNERYSADDSKCGYCGNIAGPTTTTIETQGANFNLDTKVGESTTVKYGLNYRHQEVEPSTHLKATDIIKTKKHGPIPLGVDVQNPEKTDTGAYVEVISDVGPVTLTGGLRYDHFNFKAMDGKEVSDGELNPSLGIIWQATPSLSLHANHNYATRSPRLYDALKSHGAGGIISIADNTKAERARNTEVGFNFDHQFANAGKLSVDGGYFWQRIDDAVVNPQDRHETKTIQQIENIGHITNEGYELGVGYQLGGFTARVGVAESDPKVHGLVTRKADGTTTPYTDDLKPEFGFVVGRTLTSSLSYRFNNPNLEIGVRNRDVTRTEGSLNQNFVFTPSGKTPNPPVRPSYNVTDIYANWKPLNNNKVNVNFAVNNITDRTYTAHAQRPGRGITAQGRDYRVGINFTF
ncbi:TonB-dependent receptor domain-containing protein [Moraxella marmotae]|uniref:TonB-dependent receptor domain-containing protein n=1 Tax=Moraxella marmotae TaxID=3344520 RepID=UPI0035F2EE09